LELSGYIGKPFTVDQVLEVVEQALAGTDRLPESTPTQSSVSNKALQDSLKMLYSKTGADYVLLLNSQGNPLQVVGRAEPATLSRLATFVATNFLAVTELASLLGDNSSVFKSSYYEGNNYNIYAHDVNGEYFLAVVFGAKDKPGTVWFYTKQAAATLAALLDQPSKPTTLNAGNPALVSEFDELLGSESVDDK